MPLAVFAHHAADENRVPLRGLGVLRSALLRAFGDICAVMQLCKIQSQRIGYHAEAGEAHRRGAEHRVQRQPKADEAPCGKRNADRIIEKRPKQIFVNVAQRGAAEPDRRRYIRKTALHQNNLGGIDGDIRAGTDGNSRVGTRQGGCIVNSVAHHGDLSAALQRTDCLLFSVRADAGNHLIHARLRPDGARGALIVARNHHNAQPHAAHLAHGCGAFRLNGIRNGNHAEQLFAAQK